MKILAFETSTPCGGAAVIVDGAVVAEEISRKQRSHSEHLHVFATNVLKSSGLDLAEMDAFAIGAGPGSFTGIRVATNTGKAFAAAFDKPLIAVDTLTQIASRFRERRRHGLALINAYKNMVYFGLFDLTGDEPRFLKGPGVALVESLSSVIGENEVTVAGDGWPLCEPHLQGSVRKRVFREENPMDETSPGTLALLAHRRLEKGLVFDWTSFNPLYLRASEAEEKGRGALFVSPYGKDAVHGKGD